MPTFNSYFYHHYHRLKHKCLPLDTLYLIQNEWKIRSTWRSQITLEYVCTSFGSINLLQVEIRLSLSFPTKVTSKVYLYWTLMSVRSWSFSLADTKLAWFYQKNECICCILWTDIAWGIKKLGIILDHEIPENWN